jgi:lactate permease
MVSMAALVTFLRFWKPKEIWTSTALKGHERDSGTADVAPTRFERHPGGVVLRAWVPWLILTAFVFAWGFPTVKNYLNGEIVRVATVEGERKEEKVQLAWAGVTKVDFPIASLNERIEKVPPVVRAPTKEKVVYTLNWLSATGSGILIAAVLAGLFMGYSPLGLLRKYAETLRLVRYSLITIAAMLALGFVTRLSGTDATLGLAFAVTGVFYPFFGTMLGWLGVALTGSDTASNVLFGGLQRVTAEQLGLSPTLMAAANSSGGVMGKMIDAQSIVVASTATRWYGHEGDILRYVFFHSVALAVLMGILVTLQVYVPPFTELVVHPPTP